MDTTTFETKNAINGPMHSSIRHDSAHKHVTGTAEYIDDIPEPLAHCMQHWVWRIVPMPKSSR